jgi:tetratricopeptide (TPR) repeat protein
VNGKRTSLLSTEEKLIEQIVKVLDVELSADEREKIDSHNPKSYEELAGYGLGLVYEKKGKFTDALVSYQGSVRGQEAAIVLAAEARAYKRLNSPEKALKCYETAVERDPHFAEGWYRLNLYEAQLNHKDDRALECCLKALEIAPRFGKARLSLGTRLHDLGRLDEAIAETNVAAAVLRVDPIPSYNLGLYYLESGDRVSARAWFQRSLLINPRFELARLELQKLAPR